ncbi:MAG: hypothetical protein U9R58_15410 [Chloroflexota bacterium]|nr:hypothetical protein [Chloroflexota bacterium]
MTENDQPYTEAEYCPFLGMDDGQDSHYGYPSRANRCWRSGAPSKIALDHQGAHCLIEHFTSCSIFLQEPGDIEPSHETVLTPVSRRSRLLIIPAVFTTIIVILLVLLFSDLLSFNTGFKTILPLRQWVISIQSSVLQQPAPAASQEPEQPTAVSEIDAPPLPIISTAYPPPGNLLDDLQAGNINLPEQSYITTQEANKAQSDYAGEDFIINNPDAYRIRILGERNVQVDPIYKLPEQESYSIILDGRTLTLSRGSVKIFTQSGPGYTVRILGVLAEPDREEIIKVSRDGKLIEYYSEGDNQISVYMEYESEGTRYWFALSDIPVDGRHSVIITCDLYEMQITMQNQGFAIGSYNIRIAQDDEDGLLVFMHGDIASDSLQTHYITYSNLKDDGTVTLVVDNIIEAELDRTYVLVNNASITHLPFIFQKFTLRR